MPKNGIYHDSISRCDLYSNPYDIRLQARPELVRQRAEAYLKTKDTLSSSQLRLENEIFLRIQNKAFNLSDGKMAFIVKVGKFLFLTVTLPPYIFCYGIPKWILVDGLPRFFNMTAQILRRISDKVREAAHRCVSAFKELGSKITSPILAFIQTRVEKARELFSKVQARVGQFLDTAAYPFRLINQSIIKPLVLFYNQANEVLGKIGSTYQEIKERLAAFKAQARHFFIYLPDRIAEKCLDLSDRMRERFDVWREELKKSLLPLTNWIGARGESLRSFAGTIYNMLDKTILNPFGNLKKVADKASDRIMSQLDRLSRPYREWMTKRAEEVRALWNRIDKLLNHSTEFAKEAWNSLVDRIPTVTQLTQQVVQFIPQPVISFLSPIAAISATSFNPKRAKEVLRLLFRKVQDKVDAGLQQAYRWIQRLHKAGGKALKKAVMKLKGAPIACYSLLRQILAFISTSLKGAFLLLRFMLAWIKALTRHGMIMLREMSRQLIASR